MACSTTEMQDRMKLYKFTKILTLKVAQIVVQSRQGKKIGHNIIKGSDEGRPGSPHTLQWFNLSIPDVPEVNTDTKRVLNGEVLEALSNVLCIEIVLRTNDGDEMVLEVWTVRLTQNNSCESIASISNIYYRMSIMLKSTLSISRITPAYKLSRLQNRESYQISYKIYGGLPELNFLGENHKSIKVSEVHTPIGNIQIEVAYRTKMNILPEDHKPMEKNVLQTSGNIMIKSDHFPKESPRRNLNEKRELDLSKPLTAGAFVDTIKIQELHDALSQQIPPEPPMAWLLAEKDKMEKKMKLLSLDDPNEASTSEQACYSTASSLAIDVPKPNDASKYTSLMEFPFAEGSPIAELANFYRECMQARSASGGEAWASAPVDRAAMAAQLRSCEEAVPEFDSLVAALCGDGEPDDR
ncbi:autophagy-related protein 13 homolog [Bicyclus anynana]|uniref:Autophagy-related protein 13 n=1 Tax=Bicyclus anynana TaxID=110368 RepID=A0A6J1N9R5_BICAN|nr:autophagy-related protein 13 homolog [Bicyclus anynana]XP_023944477.1 autophagy-related protein 13 homolog [Bicyclus anynana]